MRDDLGRIAAGKKADLVLVDLALPQMKPARDRLRSFVYHAADRAVREVFVHGRQVVEEVKVLTLDPAEAACRLDLTQHRMLDEAPRRDCRGRSALEITPLSLTLED
jgi:5-methylthioadenosine/S-adenosylhomocysteine deaminase